MYCRAGRIVQILYNLVGNAAKFTRTGVISITAGMSEDNNCVYVSVADTGVGIPKEKVSKIFGAFEQADMSTTRRYGGTGLGLHLVNMMVPRMYGTGEELRLNGTQGYNLQPHVFKFCLVGFIADQVATYLGDWANFTKGSTKA